jgi:diguanylate cyclase (GGDEF)-like protein
VAGLTTQQRPVAADVGDMRTRVRRWADDRRIATKIIGLSLVVTTIFTASGLVGLTNLRKIVADQERNYRINVVALTHMTAVRSAVGGQKEAVLAYILSEPGFYRDSYATVIDDTDRVIDTELAALRRIALPAAELTSLGSFIATVAMWRIERAAALDAARDGDQRKAASIVLVRSETTARAVKDRADDFLNQLVDAVAEGARRAQVNSMRAAQLMGILLLAGVLTALLLSILAARTISRPLREVVDVFARISRGDLSRGIQLDRADEVGQLGRSLNETLDVLRGAFEEMHHRASHDGLTGLPNRALLRERVTNARSNAANGIPVAMLLIDLDGFKQVNDRYGHAAGDHLLTVVAERLVAGVRRADTVSRLGGDEFAVLLDGMDNAADVYVVADRLLADLQSPTDFHGASLTPQASIGVTLWDGECPIDALMHDADVAMYAAKTGGKGRVAHADASVA